MHIVVGDIHTPNRLLCTSGRYYLNYRLNKTDLLTVTAPTTGLFIGRFQPFHKGHLATVRFAQKEVDVLVIVVGSAQKSHETRNPFTAGERIMMIRAALEAERGVDMSKIMTIPVPDVDVHSLWTYYVDMLVPRYSVVFANDRFTLLLFQERGVKTVEAPLQDRQNLMATEVRRRMAADEDWQELVPAQVAKVIIQIDGVKRVKATALDGRLHDKQNSNNNNNNNHIYQSYHHHQSK